MVKIEGERITDIFLGNAPIWRAYLGEDLVFYKGLYPAGNLFPKDGLYPEGDPI